VRDDDQALPAVVLDTIEPGATIDGWPFRPVVAVRDNSGAWVDTTCDWTGLLIELGTVDVYGNVPAGRIEFTLRNDAGRWNRYDADAVLVDWAVGNDVVCWVTDGVTDRVLFRGRVAAWDDLGRSTIKVTAFDDTAELAAPIGYQLDVGEAGDRPGERLADIATGIGFTGPTSFQLGLVTLSQQISERTPLDEARTVAQSDGGVTFVDVDGTWRYYDRRWYGGRLDQPEIPVVSATDCDAPWIVWDLELTTNDAAQADTVTIENVAGLTATYSRSTPPALRTTLVGQVEHQWIAQADGDRLASYVQRAAPLSGQLVPKGFRIHALDPLQAGIWAVACEVRLFDRVTVRQTQPAYLALPTTIDLPALVIGVRHEATAGGQWVTTCMLNRAIPALQPILYDTGHLYDTDELWSI
jgi:hypothetical protein